MRSLIALLLVLLPTLSWSCEVGSLSKCQKKLLALLSLRVDAMQTAFGDMSVALPPDLEVRFISYNDPTYRGARGSIYYDAERQLLLIPRSMTRSKTPSLSAAAYYWPFYLNAEFREAFPIIESIDNAIWGTFLHGAARSSGQSWPHSNCHAADINKRLPCRMLLTAAARLVKTPSEPFYNENRLDRLWPDDMASFQRRNYDVHHSAYADVVKLGGFPLLRPLIADFGLPRVLAYVAQNPLIVEDNSLRTSALRYQERARSALAGTGSRQAPHATVHLPAGSSTTVDLHKAAERARSRIE